ncbi:dual oxidase maturation factor 1 isoform X3 [Eurosta solidaginis]
MSANYRDALKRGLPFPILTVAEYFSEGREGFCWGGQYRAAGYFASIMLWASLASWLLMNLLLVAVPRYGAYMKALTGALLIATNIGYYCLLPKRPLIIYLEGGRLEFKLGWCYWLLLVAGILCFICGILISIIDLVWPHTFSTVLEVYYGTPYDRHVILEESSDVRYRKRPTTTGGLEEPHGLGSRILRRLSSKARGHGNVAAYYSSGGGAAVMSGTVEGVNAGTSGTMAISSIENKGYQSDVPKSPWRYPFRRSQQLQAALPSSRLQRTISQDSSSSIASAAIHISPLHKHALARMLPNPPLNRIRDVEHW